MKKNIEEILRFVNALSILGIIIFFIFLIIGGYFNGFAKFSIMKFFIIFIPTILIFFITKIILKKFFN